jgi:hypothetical protein
MMVARVRNVLLADDSVLFHIGPEKPWRGAEPEPWKSAYEPVLVRGGSRVGERRWSVDSFVVGERFTIPQRSTCFHNALVATLLKTGATAKTDLLYSWQVHGVDTGDPAD